ncbi:adenylyl cyclase-associated protein [Paragonimus westermani]|uniref:Adenylyl cyclase-associated protein n=1 Tax=Paragonimus westermani TaxID=34504 RepID=A0A5J4NL67_9TREM|nr:adenylyl cyclase-associated protein [Paragonimus westermani]
MPTRISLLSCFSYPKRPRNRRKKVDKWDSNKNDNNIKDHCDSLTDLPSVTELSHNNCIATRLNDGSVKETVSLSITSQTPGFADATSASLGGWSAMQHVDGFDVSKVNLLASEDSGSLIRPLLSALSRSSDLSEECYERLESLVQRLECLAGIRSTAADNTGLSAFQSLLNVTLPRYLALSAQLGPEIRRQSKRVHEAFELLRDLIKLSINYMKPPSPVLDEYCKPLSYKLMEIGDFDHAHADLLCRHALVTVADSAMALAWCGTQTATVFVKEIREATNAFANKTFQYCSSSHSPYALWIRSWMACLKGLQEVVDNHFRYGLVWAPSGPKAPIPPKSTRPLLMYDQSRTTAARIVPSPKRLRDSVTKSSALPNGNGRGVDKHAQLLSEISQTRIHLRHVPNPDFLL